MQDRKKIEDRLENYKANIYYILYIYNIYELNIAITKFLLNINRLNSN